MKRMLLAALAAATALVPAAMAQDRDHGGERDHGGWSRPAPPQRPWNGPGAGAPAPQQPQGWNRPAPPQMPNRGWGQDRPQSPTPPPQLGVQPEQWRGGRDWNRGPRPGWGQDRPQPPQAQPGARPEQWGGGNWNRGPRPDGGLRPDGGQRPDWRRDWGRDRDWNRDHGWDRGGDRWGNNRRWDNGWRSDRRYDWRAYRDYNRSLYRLPRYYPPYGWGYGYRRFSIGVRLNTVLFSSSYWISDPYSYRLPEVWGPYRWVRYYDDALLVDIDTGQVVDVIYGIFW